MVGESEGVTGDDPDDEGTPAFRGWIDPDDRLWRHPSEAASLGRPGEGAPRPLPVGRAAGVRLSAPRHLVTVAACLVVALTAGGLAVAAAADRATTPADGPLLLSSTPTTSASARGTAVVAEARRMALALRPSLVYLVVRRRGRIQVGTGVVAQSGGIVVTSTSLVGRSRRITAVESDGTWTSASVVGTDPAGLTVLRIADDLPPASFADEQPAAGTAELAVAERRGGNGFGPRAEVYAGTVTGGAGGDGTDTAGAGSGTRVLGVSPTTTAPSATTVADPGGRSETTSPVVSAVRTATAAIDLLATTDVDAPVGTTELGCALVQRDGQVAGLLTSVAKSGPSTAATFLPAVLVVHVVDAIVTTGSVTTGQMGVVVGDGSAVEGGPAVDAVAPGSPAATAGLAAGDVVTSVNGGPVGSVAQLRTALYGEPPGTEVSVGFDRGGTAYATTVMLTTSSGSGGADQDSVGAF